MGSLAPTSGSGALRGNVIKTTAKPRISAFPTSLIVRSVQNRKLWVCIQTDYDQNSEDLSDRLCGKREKGRKMWRSRKIPQKGQSLKMT